MQAQEAAANHPQLTIELLNTAHEMFRAGPAPAGRQIYHIGSLLAREHLALGELARVGVLAGQRAVPAVLEAAGFSHTHPDLASALEAAVRR